MVRCIAASLLLLAVLLAPPPSAGASDTTPVVVIASPAQGEVVTGDLHVAGTAGPAGSVERVEVRLAGHAWSVASGSEEWWFDVDQDVLERGPLTVEARAWDGGAYSPITALECTVDARPVITGLGYIRLGTTTVLMGNADDDGDDLVRVEVSIDDGPWSTARGTREWDHPVPDGELAEGLHTVAARAYDGNSHSLEERGSFRVVQMTADTPLSRDIVVSGGIVRTYNGTGEAHSREAVCYRVDGGRWSTVDMTDDWSFTVDTGELAHGSHTLDVRTYDGSDYSEPYSYEFYVEDPGRDPDHAYVVAVVGLAAAIALGLSALVRRHERDHR